ncbi:hypothetical protein [Vibrio phage vB_VmeM-Yong XC32]|nr:hypothetical protein [Vibrio phage vB_VmeM-Yong XC31]QAX96522.1 hypothetical protein [Vibrio phage vB_VmeM-Yong XC32]QAX96840.1 hypothetical protein [Vibrio phage vB_VmeM-Yong MS31]QAX97145.1 hypothetical protein [Vibrio phage vB_VmeM-Yong MS32]
MSEVNPNRDGYDHINVYSKGQTEIGRALTHFADLSFSHPDFGYFKTVEGAWYFIRTTMLDKAWPADVKAKIDKLKSARGYEAKKLGKEILATVKEEEWVGFPEEEFRDEIHFCNRLKLQSNSRTAQLFSETSLPLVHYYVFGEGEKAIARPGSHQWVLEGLEKIREELWTTHAKAFVYRLVYRKGDKVEMCAFVDSTEGLQGNRKFFVSLFNKLLTKGKQPFTENAKKAILGGLSQTGMFQEEKKAIDFLDMNITTGDAEGNPIFRDFVGFQISQHNGIEIAVIGDYNTYRKEVENVG